MSVPMDWMYKRPTLDTEAYLLGKPIDRSLEQLNNEGCPTSNEDLGGKPGALFVEAAASAALEAEAKLREDPLYAIRKKEEEQRRMLLNNPVRLKKMQEELERQKHQEEKKKKRGSDKDILAKMMKLKAKYGTGIKDMLSEDGVSSSHSHDRERDKRRRGDEMRGHKHRRSGSPESGRKDSTRADRPHRRSRSRSPQADRRRRPSSSHRTSSHRKPSRSPGGRGSKSPSRRKDASRSPPRDKKPFFSLAPKGTVVPRPRLAATSSKFDPAELERKRLEMMSDAKVRDVERAKNLTEYRRKEVADREHDKKVASGTSGGFIRPMLESAAQASTLESRIKANRNKSQRTRADLDKDFTKR